MIDLNKQKQKKKIIGVQVSDDLYAALVDLSAEYGTSISSVIRLVTLDYLKRYKGYKIKKGKNNDEQ